MASNVSELCSHEVQWTRERRTPPNSWWIGFWFFSLGVNLLRRNVQVSRLNGLEREARVNVRRFAVKRRELHSVDHESQEFVRVLLPTVLEVLGDRCSTISS